MKTIETTKSFLEVAHRNGKVRDDAAGTLMSGLLVIESEITEKDNRITDLERTISNFITHLEEFNGNYQPEELKKLRDCIAVERPYYPPVSYHDNWTGKEVTNEKD